MGTRVSTALEIVRGLGSPDEIRGLAEQGHRSLTALRANSHIHLPPNFSAFDTVSQAIDLAAGQRIGLLGVSNYYDFNVYGEFAKEARDKNIFPLFGVETISMQPELRDAGIRVNDPGNPGKTYLCGKGITRFNHLSPEGSRLINIIRANDAARMTAMIDQMRHTLNDRGFTSTVDAGAVVNMVVQRHGSPRDTVYLQERHIAQAFQEEIFEHTAVADRLTLVSKLIGVATKLSDPRDHIGLQNELRTHLMKAGKPAFVEETFTSFSEARQLVLELGGFPSYPVLADGASPMCEFEADASTLIAELHERGVYAVEWIPVRNNRHVIEHYVPRMRQAGFVVTAGTEHNSLDMIPLDPACKDGVLPANIGAIFWEGACVVAAHQFLLLHGECGYVDADGVPNNSLGNAEARIDYLGRLGAAVIQRYFEQFGAG